MVPNNENFAELLKQDITKENILEYIKVLDPKRAENIDTLSMDMLIGLLKTCNYQNVESLHNLVLNNWEKFLRYEKSKMQYESP